jgi:hydroxymethylpyrimidine pyrophosphatase-like HAD family hydrolase
MTYVFDIDDTLIYSDYDIASNKYVVKGYDDEEIELLNKKYDEGHTVILYTGRSWGQYDITIKQLKKAGVKYNQLVMGKPVGIYIDKDSYRSIKDFK